MVKSNIKKVFHCDKNQLWDIITNNSNDTWRTDVSKIKVIDDIHFVEYTKKDAPTYFTITKKDKLNIYELEIENANIKGKWIGKFRELENGSIEIDFTEEIETTAFMMKLLAKPYLKSMQKRYIRDLERELSKGQS